MCRVGVMCGANIASVTSPTLLLEATSAGIPLYDEEEESENEADDLHGAKQDSGIAKERSSKLDCHMF